MALYGWLRAVVVVDVGGGCGGCSGGLGGGLGGGLRWYRRTAVVVAAAGVGIVGVGCSDGGGPKG